MNKTKRKASNKAKARKGERRVSFVAKDKKLMEFMVKDIGGEIMIKPSFPSTTKHLSLYPKGGEIGHHVTHERYPKGHHRRHTQKGITSPLDQLEALLRLIAPPDNPPPVIQSLESIHSREDVIPWLERTLKGMIRPPGENTVRIIKEPLGKMFETLFFPGEGQDVVDISCLFEIENKLPDRGQHDLYATVKENELFDTGRKLAFSRDSTKIIFALDKNAVMVFSVDRLSNLSEEIMSLFGVDGYFRSLNRNGLEGID
jgi:hypothetical protein